METEVRGGGSDLPKLPPLCSAVSYRPVLGNLYQQRKETAALRDLFYSRAKKKQRKRLDTVSLGKANPSVETGRATPSGSSSYQVPPNPVHQVPNPPGDCETCRNRSGEGERGLLPTIKVSRHGKTDVHPAPTPSSQPSPKSHQKRQMTSRRPRHNDVKSPKVRKTGRGGGTCSSGTFRALTHFSHRPLPQLLEGQPRSYSLQSTLPRDLQTWQNEIVKVVPRRPVFVMPLGHTEGRVGGARSHQSTRYPYSVLSLHPATHFYRSWSRSRDKDYVIHPEWSSEKRKRLTST